MYFYPKEVGRNTDELLRMVTALEKTSSEKVNNYGIIRRFCDKIVVTGSVFFSSVRRTKTSRKQEFQDSFDR